MNNGLELALAENQMRQTQKALTVCNAYTEKYGLVLSDAQITSLSKSRIRSLNENNRIEFGDGVIEKIVYAFCDSPYIDNQNYSAELENLQDLFYCLKNECEDRLSDDELIFAMQTLFNCEAHGSSEYLRSVPVSRYFDVASGKYVFEKEEFKKVMNSLNEENN